jgi:cell fate (sporulation/competence/biofilm development) regulator YlbF (YheA/YmcA/DUF963 family)
MERMVMDALTLLRRYLAGDDQVIMSRRHVEAVIAEIEEANRAIALAGKTNADLMKTCEEYRAELSAEREVSADFAEQLKLRSESQMAKDLQDVMAAHNSALANVAKLREALEQILTDEEIAAVLSETKGAGDE